MSKAVVVVPTYNERENIHNLLIQIDKQRPKIKPQLEVLVVDDNSPDGTAKTVEAFALQDKWVHLLKGKKEGLGKAYLRGFKHATEHLNADILVQMDADFSHDPKYLPRLINAIGDEADFAIGSRYISGGSIPEEWPRLRKLNSKIGNLLGRSLTGLFQVKDVTGGFRAIKADIVKKILQKQMDVKGYVIQISLLFHAKEFGSRIIEIPIHFKDRIKGKSKLSLTDVTEFVSAAASLGYSKIAPLLQTGTLASILSFFLLFPLTLFLSQTLSLGAVLVLALSFFLISQNFINIYALTYAWGSADQVSQNASPKRFSRPQKSFTALIPARHEEAVIADTLKAIAAIDYPVELKEAIVICREDDKRTIARAQEAINQLNDPTLKLTTFDDHPINKPRALNHGLELATKDHVVIFDAEDQPHPDIFNIANTVFVKDNPDVLQSGVQLVNYQSRWFSSLNVLEYFFWFKSSLHFFSKLKALTLGGNTVFIKRDLLKKIRGWDETCLTEDADIGIRLSRLGAKFRVVYDAAHATREETPMTVSGFIKQRTRWNQGFIQILLKGDWLKLPHLTQKLAAFYALTMPLFLGMQVLLIPFALAAVVLLDMPVLVAMLSILPLLLVIFQLLIYAIGLYEFTREYRFKYPWSTPFKTVIQFFPYSFLLVASSIRAIYRQITDATSWEKTAHTNQHRSQSLLNVITGGNSFETAHDLG